MTTIVTCLCLVLMIVVLIMALITNDAVESNLFASLGIITGNFGFSRSIKSKTDKQ